MDLKITIRVNAGWRPVAERRLTLQAETVEDLAEVAADLHRGLGELIQRTIREAAAAAEEPTE